MNRMENTIREHLETIWGVKCALRNQKLRQMVENMAAEAVSEEAERLIDGIPSQLKA